MAVLSLLLLVVAPLAVIGQQAGTLTPETHPQLSWSECTKAGSCTSKHGEVVIDANWRWVHNSQGQNCYTGNKWDAKSCPDDKTCAQNCALDGAQYQSTYGVSTSGNALTLKFVTQSQNKNIGSRLYFMESESKYHMFKLLNQEFSFDVDVSKLPCGLNGALYFVSMEADGGMSKHPTNKAGAKYGTGYCDAQCPRDIKFINGEANPEGWVGTTENSGNGLHGSCCAEMDVWEANSMATAFTPHPCSTNALHMCQGDACGGSTGPRYGGTCDPDGCDFNPYRQGNTSFFGPGKTVDTTKPFTVVTQFLTSDNTATGTLHEIRRFYVQGGKVIPNAHSASTHGSTANSITQEFCTAQKKAFKDQDSFTKHGGLKQMGEAIKAGMVLVLSLWDDYAVDMLWLDAVAYPKDGSPSTPGVARGPCALSTGVPAQVEAQTPNAQVVYSNIKVGPINSTFTH